MTPKPINLSSYRFVLGEDGDGSGGRSASAFRLYASNSLGDVQSSLVSSATIALTYTANYGSPQIAMTETLNVLNVQFFRMEVDRTFNGPRVFELDGFGAVVPEPITCVMLVLGMAAMLTSRWKAVSEPCVS